MFLPCYKLYKSRFWERLQLLRFGPGHKIKEDKLQRGLQV